MTTHRERLAQQRRHRVRQRAIATGERPPLRIITHNPRYRGRLQNIPVISGAVIVEDSQLINDLIDVYGIGDDWWPELENTKHPYHPFCLEDLREDLRVMTNSETSETMVNRCARATHCPIPFELGIKKYHRKKKLRSAMKDRA